MLRPTQLVLASGRERLADLTLAVSDSSAPRVSSPRFRCSDHSRYYLEGFSSVFFKSRNPNLNFTAESPLISPPRAHIIQPTFTGGLASGGIKFQGKSAFLWQLKQAKKAATAPYRLLPPLVQRNVANGGGFSVKDCRHCTARLEPKASDNWIQCLQKYEEAKDEDLSTDKMVEEKSWHEAQASPAAHG
nr:hypothetical protein Iba_chr05eCG10610 [Ipomoea batatas]